MSLVLRMREAGLGRAMRDARNKTHEGCKSRHSVMLNRHNYSYCPHCGVKLEYIAKCDKCEISFVSKKAFDTHQAMHTGIPAPAQCPCRATGDQLEKQAEPRYRCKECGTVFDWVFKHNHNKSKQKYAQIVYRGQR